MYSPLFTAVRGALRGSSGSFLRLSSWSQSSLRFSSKATESGFLEEERWRSPYLPRCATYEEMCSTFEWKVPSKFNIAQHICDRHANSVHADSPAIIFLEEDQKTTSVTTFKELQMQSSALAFALTQQSVQKQDCIAILLSQRSETAVCHIAANRMGCIAVPLFTLFGPDALLYRLKTSGAKVLITDLEGMEKVREIVKDLPELRTIVIAGDELHPSLSHSTICDGRVTLLCYQSITESCHTVFPVLDTDATYPSTIIFTSGTTGPPKGALHAHQVLLGHLPGVEFPHNLFPRPVGSSEQQIEQLLFYTPADWAWIGGLMDVLLPSLFYGVPVLAHRMKKFDPESNAYIMQKYGVTNSFIPPTALKMMRDNLKANYSHMISIGSGGESLGSELLEWGRKTYGITINEFYGQTEANLLIGNCSAIKKVRPGKMGVAMPGRKISIIDDEGKELEPNQIGNIACKKGDPVMFIGYYKDPVATKKKFVKDWLVTGDLGSRDADGYFQFFGRDDDVIKSSGYRIGPAEVEEAILKHSLVSMCAVVGVPDDKRGQIVKAFCVLKSIPSGTSTNVDQIKQEIQANVKKHLAAYEYPREIEFVESLPMTTTGKIQRKVLRDREIEKLKPSLSVSSSGGN